MADFKENTNFQSNLLIEYMEMLKTKEEKEEFNRMFEMFEKQYEKLKNSLTSIDQLKKVQNIIEYKKNIVKGQII